MPNFQKIGEFAVEKAEEYEKSINAHSELVKQRFDLDEEIKQAELNGNKEILPELYKRFRTLRAEQEANRCYRQKFCDDFLFAISEMAKEENK